MNKTVITILLLCFAQVAVAQLDSAEQVASDIANKMRDTLGLTATQRNTIYGINMHIHDRKVQASQNPNSTYFIQKIERSRDSFYRGVLEQQEFLLYIQKKSVLLPVN